MTATLFDSGHHTALIEKKWSDVMFTYGAFGNWFSRFIGPQVNRRGVNIETSPNAMIQLKTDFQAGTGDTVTFPLLAPLSGEGVIGDGTLEGSEEAMAFYDWAMSLIKTRHAIRTGGSLSDRRPRINLRAVGRDAVGQWMARKMDTYTICALSGIASADTNIAVNAPSATRKWAGGQSAAGVLSATANNLDAELVYASKADMQFGPQVISAVRRKAIVSEPIIRPIVIEGQDMYAMLLHPLQVKSLKAATEWNTIQAFAGVRGLDNPIFTGALGVYDGVVLHECPKIETRLGEGGTTATEYFDAADYVPQYTTAARALFCGAQAAVQAFGQKPKYVEKLFDYDDKVGVAIGAILAVSKPEFNSVDYGVMVVDTQTAVD